MDERLRIASGKFAVTVYAMRIRRLFADNLAPFGELEIEFPAVENPTRGGEVHLLVGVNGTGKTRLLCLLAAVLGNSKPLTSRGGQSDLKFVLTETVGIRENTSWRPLWSEELQKRFPKPMQTWSADDTIKTLAEAIDKTPCFSYNGSAHVSKCAIQMMAPVKPQERGGSLLFEKPEKSSTDLAQALANLKMRGSMHISSYGSLEAARLKSRELQLSDAIERNLSQVTGQRVFFEVVENPETTLKVIWGGKSLSFHQLPDGLRSILGWMVEIAVMMNLQYPDVPNPWEQPAFILLDEIDRHLHPAWQRQVLPMVQKMFPGAQFFISTHSPFLISSLNEGYIHHLKMLPDGSVKVQKPTKASPGDSYVTIVDELMGIPWYDPETEAEIQKFHTARDAALQGDENAAIEARAKALELAQRSPELEDIMGRELRQLERHLQAKPAA